MKTINIKVKKLSGVQKFIGLIGEKNPQAVFFETRWGIHTFGVKFPIDVVILDSTNRVVIMKKAIMPNKFYFWNPRYYRVLELPEGSIKNFNLNRGDRINFDNTSE